MSDRVKVGTSKVTFRVRAFDYPQIELASVEVDVPMYTKTDNKLDNMQQGHVTADVPDGFNEKVKDALQVFADTLEASFTSEWQMRTDMATNVTQKDKTLNEIMAWCDQLSMEIKCTEDATTDRTYGKLRGLYLVYEHCQNMLGHSGSMPSEVPNQSEDAKK